MMDIRIIVATHKKYRMPEDGLYLPVHAGHLGKDDIGYVGDDTGENISDRNWYYSELSAIYWAWKNVKADALGTAHYRRHFTMSGPIRAGIRGKWESILTGQEAERLLEQNEIIVAGKRPYIFETNRNHYGHSHDPKELELMRHIISERCPEYLDAYEAMLDRRWAHMFNMFIMRWDKLDAFCTWWFDLLFEFERRVDMTGYPQKEKRAFIDEILLDVWLIRNQYPYREVRVMYMEKQNWPKKIFWFFWRKFVTHKTVYREEKQMLN